MKLKITNIVNLLKIVNCKLKIDSRGEIATILTLISVVVMVAGIAAGTQLAKSPQTTKSNAAYPDWIWDTDCPAGGNQASCICGRIPQSTGFCSPACTTLGNKKCIANKWADPNDSNAWGCWGDAALDCKPGLASPTPTGPTPTGPTPTAGSGGGPPPGCTAGEWKCNNNVPDMDTRNSFCGTWCDGRGRWLYEASQVYFNGDGTQCGGNPSKLRSEGCPTTPTPTTAAGGGGGTPGPGEGGGTVPTSAPKSGGYLIVNAGGVIKTSISLNPNPTTILVYPQNWLNGYFPNEIDYGALPFPTGFTAGQSNGVNYYQYDLPDRKDKPYVVNLDGNIDSPIKVDIVNQEGTSIANAENYTVCYFPTPKLTPPEIYATIEPSIVPTIVKYCSNNNKVNQIDVDLTNVTPEPTAASSILTFNIRMNNQTGDSQYRVVLADQSCDKTSLPDCNYSGISVTDGSDKLSTNHPDKIYVKPSDKIKVAISLNPDTEEVVISMIGDLYHNEEIDKKYIDNRVLKGTVKVSCLLQDIPFTLNKGGVNNDLGDLIQIDMNKDSCSIIKIIGSKDSFLGSANADFDQAMDKWKSGEIDATEMSSFINQLTRTPGLQVTFCDPVKGECSPIF